ncbi:MAG: transposase [Canidatus Methanoxibalbensis ujae]|nr:transposase [Candidatus Methanoxibalbensis ujae]
MAILLSELNKAKDECGKLKPKDTQALIVKLKQEENPELNKVYAKVLQMVNYQLWSNIKALAELKQNGKKVGKLRYKTGNSFKTLNFNQSGFGIDFENKKLILSKIGSIPIKLHRPVEGKIKGVIVKRERSGRWYAIVQVENNAKQLPPTGKTVGIDVGIRHFLTDSDGRHVENPRFYERTLKSIKILQKNPAKKSLKKTKRLKE